MKLVGKCSKGAMGGIAVEGKGGRFDQNTLYACVKLSNNKLCKFFLDVK